MYPLFSLLFLRQQNLHHLHPTPCQTSSPPNSCLLLHSHPHSSPLAPKNQLLLLLWHRQRQHQQQQPTTLTKFRTTSLPFPPSQNGTFLHLLPHPPVVPQNLLLLSPHSKQNPSYSRHTITSSPTAPQPLHLPLLSPVTKSPWPFFLRHKTCLDGILLIPCFRPLPPALPE